MQDPSAPERVPAPAPAATSVIRASDADRDDVLDLLATSLAEGRLDQGEYDRRSSAALAATTCGELAPLTADLPDALKRAQERKDLAEWLAEWRYWLGGAFLMTGIWGVHSASQGELTHYWPWMPLAIWAAVLVAIAIWPSDRDRSDDRTDDRADDRGDDRPAGS